jgi:hypothetical protein
MFGSGEIMTTSTQKEGVSSVSAAYAVEEGKGLQAGKPISGGY